MPTQLMFKISALSRELGGEGPSLHQVSLRRDLFHRAHLAQTLNQSIIKRGARTPRNLER